MAFGGFGHEAWWVDNGRSPGVVPMKQWSGFNPSGPPPTHTWGTHSLGLPEGLLTCCSGLTGPQGHGGQQVALRPGRGEV